MVAVSPSGSEAAGTAVTVVGSTEAPTNPPAGSPAPSDTPTLPPPPTSTPAPTAPPFKLPDGVNLGDKLFSADFFQGWPTENFPTVKMGIKDGKYVLEIGPQDAGIRSSGVVKQKNLFQQIEVTPNSCPTKTGFGLRFRMQDNSNYYRFSIFCDNTFISSAVVSGGVTELVSGKLPGGLDVTVSDLHTIGVAAFNDGFTFYLDDQIVGTANDNRLDQGDVAFYAFSQATSVIQVAFDNWQVWSLR